MSDSCFIGDDCNATDKENLEGSAPYLKRRSLPCVKMQIFQDAQPCPPSLALTRRPLRDSRNLLEPHVDTATANKKQECSLQCSTTAYNVIQKPLGNPSVSDVIWPVLNSEESDILDCSISLLNATADIEDVTPLSDLTLPKHSWMNHEGSFFPTVHPGLEEVANLGTLEKGHQPMVNVSSQRPLHFRGKHRSCLSPVSEMSPVKEVEESQERIDSLYQNFFARECADVIDNIRRTSFQPLGTCDGVGVDRCNVTNIAEESLPYPNCMNYTTEGSLMQADMEASTSAMNSLSLDAQKTKEAVEHVSETSEGTSVLSGTRIITSGDDLRVSLEGTYCMPTSQKKIVKPEHTSGTNDTYVLQDAPHTCPDVTVDVTQSNKGVESESNNTYELQPIVGNEVSAADAEGDVVLDLDDTLDIKANLLVTSTPMPKPSSLTRDADITSLVCQQFLAVNLETHLDEVEDEQPCKNSEKAAELPKPAAPQPCLETTSFRRISQKKSLLPPFNAKPRLQGPLTSRCVSLPAMVGMQLASKGISGKLSGPVGRKSLGFGSQPKAPEVPANSERRFSIAGTKPPTSGIQKPRSSGVPLASSHLSRLSFRPLGQSSDPPGHGPAGSTGLKGRSLKPPTAAQKQPRGNTDDSLPISKRKRVDDPAPTAGALNRIPRPAACTQGLRRTMTGLRAADTTKLKHSDAHRASIDLPKVSAKPTKGITGLKKPAARLLEPKTRNAVPVAADGSHVTAAAPPPSPPVPMSATRAELHDENVTNVSNGKDCANCIRYQEEIRRLREALEECRQTNGKL